jgi:hypothetical protein
MDERDHKDMNEELNPAFLQGAVMRCAECKHFTSNGELYGSCSNDKFVMGYHSKFADYGEKRKMGELYDIIEPDGVSVEGDEGWGFEVGIDFGCKHFEHIA